MAQTLVGFDTSCFRPSLDNRSDVSRLLKSPQNDSENPASAPKLDALIII